MLSIILYTTTSDSREVTKTLSNAITLNGTLKEDTDLLNPVILVESSSVITSNYVYISTFGRYYYIRDIEVVNNKLWRLTLKVDVLMSYAAEIKNNSAVIARQQNLFNLYLNDPNFTVYNPVNTVTQTFPNGFTNTASRFLVVTGG